jgi:DNA-binding NtrC family response regulator
MRVLLVNIAGDGGETIVDLLRAWEYSVIRIDSREDLILNIRKSGRTLVIFQFHEFSSSEYAYFYHVRESIPLAPLVAISPILSLRSVFELGRCGATDFLAEPFDPQELKRMVDKYMQKNAANTIGFSEGAL